MEIIKDNPVKDSNSQLKKKIIDMINNSIYNKEKIIKNLELQINSIKNEIKNDKNQLYNICDHNWVPDHSYNNYDRTPRYCSLCGLNN